MHWLAEPLRLLATALTFMTRIPVARWAYAEPEALGRASAAFPLVGAIVAVLVIAIWWLALPVFGQSIAAGLALLAGVLLTSGFHEDGLADTADGLGGAFERKRKLEIMRDARLGSYGALALVFALGLKWLALVQMPPDWVAPALLLAHVLARWTSLPLAWGLPYVQAPGSGSKPVAEGIGGAQLAWGSLWAALLIAPCGVAAATVALALALAVSALAAALFNRQLGGVTGDCLGAANQATETAIYLGLLVLSGSLPR